MKIVSRDYVVEFCGIWEPIGADRCRGNTVGRLDIVDDCDSNSSSVDLVRTFVEKKTYPPP